MESADSSGNHSGDLVRESGEPGRTVDAGSCDREPIHIPGSIQPHGFFLALREPELRVVQASDNLGPWLGVEAVALLGAPLHRVLGAEPSRRVREMLGRASFQGVNPLRIDAGGRVFDGILHRSEGLLILELEPRDTQEEGPYDLIGDVLGILDRLHAAPSVPSLCQLVTDEVRRLARVDRAVVYQFHEDAHGEVVAESRSPDLPSYLNLHFPASDVPAQARRLYVVQRTRQIVDVSAVPVPIVPADNPLTGRPVDLSLSSLRSVSPCHIQYLRNMGVRSSMSVSLIREGALWGLVACHGRAPHHVSYQRRVACEFLGHVLSWQIEIREKRALAEARLRATVVSARLIEAMSAEHDATGSLSEALPTIVDLVQAEGVAVLHEGRWTCLGRTPRADVLDAVARSAQARARDGIYVTDRFCYEAPAFAALKDVACGVLAVSFSDPRAEAPCDCVLWFRPEVVQTVLWGGDPGPVSPAGSRESYPQPRASFEAWRELVRCRSLPWRLREVEAASAVRGAVVSTLLSRAAELGRLNRDLRDAVQMRDDFMSMASHELRTPIFTLSLQIDGLLRASDRRRDGFTPEVVRERLALARRQVKRLEQLVGSLLDFSQISAGRLTLDLEEVDLPGLIADVISRFGDELAAVGSRVRLRAGRDLVGRWDLVRLDQVITNLLANAIKYGAGRPIEVEASRVGDRVRVAVVDHGIGIEEVAQARIFDRFERAVSPGHYSGFGLGLWIVRQIVERHGGSIRVRSEPGRGSAFVVDLPIATPEPAAELQRSPAGGGAGGR